MGVYTVYLIGVDNSVIKEEQYLAESGVEAVDFSRKNQGTKCDDFRYYCSVKCVPVFSPVVK